MAQKLAWHDDVNAQLNCICGLCKHKPHHDKCIYWKIVDSRDPDIQMKKEINKLIGIAVKQSLHEKS